MQENNFEKEVQQKLDGLHLTPSEPVWQKIEASIKKKRERRLLFWLLPVALVIGGLAWWGLTTTPREKTVVTTSPEPTEAVSTFSKPHTGETDTNRQPTASASVPQQPKEANKFFNENAVPQLETNETSKQPAARRHEVFQNKVAPAAVVLKNTSASVATSVPETLTDIPTPGFPRTTSIETNRPGLPPETQALLPPVDTAANRIRIDLKAVEKIGKPAVQATKKAWQWYVTSRVGASNINENPFSLSGDKSSAAGFSDEFASPSSGNGARPDDLAAQTTSLYASGPHFSIGAGVKKAVTKRSFLVAGLQYSFYRNHVTAAPQLPADSIARSLYSYMLSANANTTTRIASRFTNTFYFIELPVGLEHRLLKNRALHLQYGATLRALVSGEALRYDDERNVYQQDAAALRRTGVALYALADYTLWTSKGLTLQAGPHVQYGLSQTFKNSAPKSPLVSGGLAVTMGF